MKIVRIDGAQIVDPLLPREAANIANRVLETLRKKAAKSRGEVDDADLNEPLKAQRCILSRGCGVPNHEEN